MYQREFQTVNFRTMEHILGIQKPHDLKDILLNFPKPFGISHSPGLRQGMDQYEMALWDGDDRTVYLGVNHNPFIQRKIDEPAGLFYLERDRNRLLYDPASSIPLRDSYRGFYQNDFGTTAKLTDLVELLERDGIPIYQISSLLSIPGVREFLQDEGMRVVSSIDQRFSQGKTDSSIFQPYRLEGSVSLDAITKGELLPVLPVSKDQDWNDFSNKIAKDW